MPSKASTGDTEQYRELTVEELKRELCEAHRREAATAEVLKVISSSPADVQAVFHAIVRSAVLLCGAMYGTLVRFDGELMHLVAGYNYTPEVDRALREAFPMRPSARMMSGRAILSRDVVQVDDALDDPDYSKGVAQAGGFRSMLAAPMLHNGRPIGAIVVNRGQPGAFSPTQIQLLRTFADQAVIAIENTRFFQAEQASKRELTEALEQQTATADVLKVISRSALDLQRVLDALVESAARLCDANDAAIFQIFGDSLRLVADHKQTFPMAGTVGQLTLSLVRGRIVGRAVIDRRTIHVADALAETDEYPESWMIAQQYGHRTMLAVPLVHAGEAIGVIYIHRTEVRPFTERQIELVSTFADQAVIAIENTRLFEEVQARTRELTETLEQQTATSEILGVISRSPTKVEPIFDAIVKSAARLCDGVYSTAAIFDGELLHLVANYNYTPDVARLAQEIYPRRPDRQQMLGRAILSRANVQIEDALVDPEYPQHLARSGGWRGMLAVPMLRGENPIGAICVMRGYPGPFSETQIKLLETFADQAVVAIENARLFEEVQARTRDLAKTVEDLEIASQHKNQFVANMSHELRTPLAAILGYAELMQEGFYEPLARKSLDALTRIRSNGKHLLGLINTVLDIAKIESGQFTLNMAEYAIESVVETVRSATESLAQNKKLTLTTEVAKSLPVGLGDEQRLTQVLLNLIGNAIKFTDAGEVRVTANAVNGHFNVSVTDTGPGIPAEHQTRIFEQFHQIDSSNTKAKGGTGLGLAIAKQIVEMHGGRIWVESTLGMGSNFQMELPIRAEIRRDNV